MRLSQLFGRTLRETPAEAKTIGHQLLIRAGMIRRLSTGAYGYLPLGRRTLGKIEQIVRGEMEAVGGQELLMPQAQEEAVADLIRREVSSYRQLPSMLYQLQTDSERVAAKALSLHADPTDLDAFYPRILHTCENILRCCGLEAISVESIAGHQFMAPSEAGEESFLFCSECDYAASAEGAKFAKKELPEEAERPVERVATPGCKTIQAVADYLGMPTEKTLKAVFYATEEGEVIFVVIRGDLEVSEAKLKEALGGQKLHPATEEELSRAGVVAGYASPVGLTGIKVVADDSVRLGFNFVAGANEEGYHFKNVSFPRDFAANLLADIALAREGYACPRCGGELVEAKGLEVGHMTKMGTRRSKAMGLAFVDRDGRAKPIIMGSYTLNMGRMMAAIVKQHHDGKGIIWPAAIAPYQVHLISLGDEATEKAEEVYKSLLAGGLEVLYDDRDESAGVKFNDADLMGMPLRLAISRRTLKKSGVEVKLRSETGYKIVGFNELNSELRKIDLRIS